MQSIDTFKPPSLRISMRELGGFYICGSTDLHQAFAVMTDTVVGYRRDQEMSPEYREIELELSKMGIIK